MKLCIIALRNVFRNGRRSVLSIIAVAVAAMTITLLFSFLEGIKKDIQLNSWNYETGEVRLRHVDFDRFEHLNPVQYVVPDYQNLTKELLEQDNVAAVSPRINVNGVAFIGERQIPALGIGVDIELEQDYHDLSPFVIKGRMPAPGTSEAVMGFSLANELKVKLGDTATFLTQTRLRSTNAFTVDVVGLIGFPIGSFNSRVFILPIESADRYLRMEGGASEIYVKSSDGRSAHLAEHINAMLADMPLAAAEGQVQEQQGRQQQQEKMDQIIRAVPWMEVSSGYNYMVYADVIYSLIALLFFILGSTVIINTTMMTVNERTREIGTLSAMGMNDRELVRLFFTEATYLGLAGSFLGVMVGIGITLPLERIGFDFGEYMDMVDMAISAVLYPVLNMRSTVGVFLYSFFVAVAASYLPARRAARLKPVDALRS